MKTIRIKSLKLVNFKGIRFLELNELSKETFIHGENGTGKTSVFDAFTWLLFGKDSSDRKDFEIKTLNSKNQVIPKIDHEVEAVIEVDGELITLRRIFKEKWVKRRGSIDTEYSGNETLYEWNGVPHNAGEYASKISNLVDEKVFKLITNPIAFNSLKWQDQRDVLIDMTGTITDFDIAAGDTEFEALMSKLTGKTLDEYKKQVKASISKSKKELQAIPTRIDEVERAKPEALDFPKIREDLKKAEANLHTVDDQITDELKAQQDIIDQKSEIKSQIQKLDFEISDVKHEYQVQAKELFRNQNSDGQEIKRKYAEKQAELRSANNALNTLTTQLNSKKEQLTQISEEIVGLRTKWEEKNAEPIKFEMDTCCPTCKQELPAEGLSSKREQMEKNLLDKKNDELAKINAKGKSLKETLAATAKERSGIQEQIDNKAKQINEIKSELEALNYHDPAEVQEMKSEMAIYSELISADTKIKPLTDKIEDLNKQMNAIKGVDVDDLKDKRETLRTDVQYLEIQLGKEKEIEKHNQRIEELSAEEKQLGQATANLEKDLFTIEAFEKAKSTRIEESVNNRFNMVNFKLFETQINGGEVPTCKALINGVPFSDANTASKINAGLDIINTLCMHYKANAPIFIDNRESVIQLLPTESQIINLVVSEADKKLRVETMSETLV